MALLNDNYLKLKAGYLFPEIGRRVKAFCDANPEAAKRLIRCGIGDVTEPLPSAVVAAMHKAGVTIVAGTDGSGIELVRELELYVEAGFTPAEALRAATLAPAHLVGVDGKTGSITVGKQADLVLVDGDPSTHIGDLRHTRTVMMDGGIMDADALRAAGGFAGRPKFAD